MDREIATPEVLLAHSGFVSGLAHGLVFAGEGAEDVVQETLLYAVAHPPAAGPGLRSWLAKVARNVVRQDRRSRMRRLARELEAARTEVVPSTAEIAEREETRRRVVDAVLRLDEPYRTTLVLRYLEEEPPRAIARRLGVKVETVRTRVKRGLARLREDLAKEHGGDARLACLALLPLARVGLRTPAAAAATAGGVAGTKALGIACAVVFVTVAVVLWPGERATSPSGGWRWRDTSPVPAPARDGAYLLTVLDAETGRPVAGAFAGAHPRGEGGIAVPPDAGAGPGRTGVRGRVRLPAPGPSTPHLVWAGAEGYETTAVQAPLPGPKQSPRRVVLRLRRKR